MLVNHPVTADAARGTLLTEDELLSKLRAKTPEQIAVWVEENVNTITDVKMLLTKLLLIVRVM
jgi:hypothetical protein